MRTSSCKAKGRKLQDWIKTQIASVLGVDIDKIHTAIMGQSGQDVWLDKDVTPDFPYSIEAKNQEKFKGIYDIMEQAKTHSGLEPLAVLKMNRKKPLVIVDAEHFFTIVNNNKRGK